MMYQNLLTAKSNARRVSEIFQWSSFDFSAKIVVGIIFVLYHQLIYKIFVFQIPR